MNTIIPSSSESNDPIHVFLIEDDENDVLLFEHYLKSDTQHAYTVDHSHHLESGLENVRPDYHDILIVDLSLPDADMTKTTTITPVAERQIPVVVLTGHNDEELGIAAIQHGAQDYLVKSHVDGRVLSRAIRYAIERKRQELERTRMLEEIKVLRGLLTVCAHCRKLKNEHDEWEQMESYIQRHSDASFSHGYCPPCLQSFVDQARQLK